MSTELLASVNYKRLPSEVRFAIQALSVLIERIGNLPKPDREDLFALIQAWKDAKDECARDRIHAAMEEIIAQGPVRADAMALPGVKLSRELEKWAIHVGKRINDLRKRKNLTQEELASKSGLPQSHISRIERAEHSPTRLTVSKIAKALGVSIGEIDPSE